MFFVDNDTKKHGLSISIDNKEYPIKAPDEIKFTDFDKIVIGSRCGEDILRQLQFELKVPLKKIDNFLLDNYHFSFKNFLNNFSKICQEKALEGNIAELGVYQGDCASRMNKYFKNKKLYLFDTFEGYNQKDFSHKDNEASVLGVGHLNNTSVELVMSKMPYPEQVIVKKGWFPQTTQGLDNEKFCLVNLDPDIYQVVLNGLEFFYPKMVKGGVIIINGYFSPHSGVKKATDEFIAKFDLQLLPLGYNNIAVAILKT